MAMTSYFINKITVELEKVWGEIEVKMHLYSYNNKVIV